MAYLEFEIPVRSWSNSEKEILFAKLSQIGFEGFVEGAVRVLNEAYRCGMHHENTEEESNWILLSFSKPKMPKDQA